MLSDDRAGSILVVDDDEDLRETLVDLLEAEGYAVAQASDGAAALDLLRHGLRPQVILLDLMMPRMDGETFCKVWHEDDALSPIPVILLSAEPSIAAKAASCGASGFVQKPLEPERLFRAIEPFAAHRT
jgi:CheY-like chemotaxis protein